MYALGGLLILLTFLTLGCGHGDRELAKQSSPPGNSQNESQKNCNPNLLFDQKQIIQNKLTNNSNCNIVYIPAPQYIEDVELDFFQDNFYQPDCTPVLEGFQHRKLYLQNIKQLKMKLKDTNDIDQRKSLTKHIEEQYIFLSNIYNNKNFKIFDNLAGNFQIKFKERQKLLDNLSQLNPDKEIKLDYNKLTAILINPYDSIFNMDISQCVKNTYCAINTANYCSLEELGLKLHLKSSTHTNNIFIKKVR